MSAPLKLIFMGTPAFAVPTLQALIDSHHTVVAVYSQPPRPAGRGKKEHASPIHQLAEQHSIPVYTPNSLKSPEIQAEFAAHGADAAIVVAYGLLLPEAILNGCSMGCVNVHPSALPRWRGAAPLPCTLLAGDTTTDICIMQMDKGLDTGAVLLRTSYDVPEDITTGELHDWLSTQAAPLVLETLEGLQAGTITPQPQQGEATYAPKIDKEDRPIDWSLPVEFVHNHIRGLSPYPGATFDYQGEIIKVLRSENANTVSFAKAGTVMNDQLSVACGDGGVIRLKTLQRAGKSAMNVDEFLRGFPFLKAVNSHKGMLWHATNSPLNMMAQPIVDGSVRRTTFPPCRHILKTLFLKQQENMLYFIVLGVPMRACMRWHKWRMRIWNAP
jgi:methionyl-tRNA formyltransferase